MQARPIVLGLVLTLGLTLLLGGCATPQASYDSYLQGELAAGRGDMNQALAELSQAIATNPKLTLAFMARGRIYKTQGQYARAAEDFQQATTLEPNNFDAFYQLGLMYQYLRRFSESIAAYQQAVQIRPLDPDTNMNLAIVYTQTGQPLRGLSYAQRAVSGASESPHTHGNLGILYAALGYQDKAIEELRKAIELNANAPEVYLNLASEYMKQDKWQVARNVLQGAERLGPNAAVRERMGLTYYKTNDLAQALASYRGALEVDARYTPALNGLGVVLMTQALQSDPPDVAKAREAVDTWKKSLAIDASQPAILRLVERYGGQFAKP